MKRSVKVRFKRMLTTTKRDLRREAKAIGTAFLETVGQEILAFGLELFHGLFWGPPDKKARKPAHRRSQSRQAVRYVVRHEVQYGERPRFMDRPDTRSDEWPQS